MELINYYISENYIPHWTIQDALREILQNFIDYGEYKVEYLKTELGIEYVSIYNNFDPISTDLLIIGESNKSDNQIGKYGEGLKMGALVLLRNGYQATISSSTFLADFRLIDNTYTNIKTLGVQITDIGGAVKENFAVVLTIPHSLVKEYIDTIIKSEDILHTREGYGSIVDKPKGNMYVGGLFVCNLKGFNYAYNFQPSKIQLDRDRKVPKDWDIKWNVSKIQETYTEFDKVGKSTDVIYSSIPSNHIPSYTPKLVDDKVIFTTTVKNKEGKLVEEVVSERFTEQLIQESYFSKIVFKLKSIVSNSLGIPELAFKFRHLYCHSDESEQAFEQLMLRLGVVLKPKTDLPF